MPDKPQSKGRDRNAAAPLGDRPGLVSEKQARKTGRDETRSAGPDGPRPPPVETKR